MELNARLELMTVRSRPEVRSTPELRLRVGRLTDWATSCSRGWNTCNLFIYFKCIYLFWERKHEWGEGQRERETQNPKQAPGSELSAQCPTWCSNSPTARSWPEQKSDTRWTEPPGASDLHDFLDNMFSWVFSSLTGFPSEAPWLSSSPPQSPGAGGASEWLISTSLTSSTRSVPWISTI